MRIERLIDLPQMAHVLEMQRELSSAASEHELIARFAARYRSLTGATLIVDLDTFGLTDGSFRIRDRIRIGKAVSAEAPNESRWHEPATAIPVQRSGVLSPLLEDREPVMIRGLAAAQETELLAGCDPLVDALLVPVYHGGEVSEWLLVVAPAGTQVDSVVLRMAIANLNLLSRGIAQQRLHTRVHALKERLAHGLDEVARIQRSLLPELPDVPGYELAVHYRPAAIAGGDYYDFRRFDDDTLGIVIADVAGHGPGAAVVMAMLRTIMSAYRLGDLPPAEVVPYANRLLADGLAPGAFVTTVFVALKLDTGEGVYFNCGHCLPRILRADGSIARLEGGGSPPLGILPELAPAPGEFRLGPGDRLLLFTDGVSEAPARRGSERFGDDRLERAILEHEASGAALSALTEALDQYSGDTLRRDDECALLLRRCP